MANLKTMKGKQIHQRDITASTFEVDETTIVVEGVLKDKNLDWIYKISGEKIPPSVYHHMIVRWLVKGPDMKIVDLEVEMPTVPVDECHQTKKMLENIIGVKISATFTKNIGSLFGGVRGCAHIKSLLLLMGTTAIQGYWCMSSRDQKKMAENFGNLTAAIKNTCYVWRKDGDLFKTYGRRQE